MTLRSCQARPYLTRGLSPELTEAVSIIAQECLYRARRWPTPPQWELDDWLRDVAAQAERAAVEALEKYDPELNSSPASFLVCHVMARLLVRHQREWLRAGRWNEITLGADETHSDCCSSLGAGFPDAPQSGAWATHEDFIHVIGQVRELNQRIADEFLWAERGRN